MYFVIYNFYLESSSPHSLMGLSFSSENNSSAKYCVFQFCSEKEVREEIQLNYDSLSSTALFHCYKNLFFSLSVYFYICINIKFNFFFHFLLMFLGFFFKCFGFRCPFIFINSLLTITIFPNIVIIIIYYYRETTCYNHCFSRSFCLLSVFLRSSVPSYGIFSSRLSV